MISENKLKLTISIENKDILLNQQRLDHEQHYDIDGVTQINGELVIPSNFKIETHFTERPVGTLQWPKGDKK